VSTSVIEPGTRLAGRYRLETRITDGGGSTLWRAIDETLARPVAVRTFAQGFPRVGEVVTAARAASRLTDPRLAQVFDAEDNTDRAYVVSEWVSGETLEDLVVSGPIEPSRAVALILEAAEALAAAHAAGLAHLSLTPRHLLWTTGGTVKVTGLGVIAALSGLNSEGPALTDTQGLGRMLYAALTAHWPGPEETALPLAPQCGERACSPRRVRADIPALVDEIACRTLPLSGSPPDGAITAPGELVMALRKVPRIPPPFVGLHSGAAAGHPGGPGQQPHGARLPGGRPTGGHGTAAPTAGSTAAMSQPAAPRGTTITERPGEAGWAPARHRGPDAGPSRGVIAGAAALVLAVAGVGGWLLLRGDNRTGPPQPRPTQAVAPPSTELEVAEASGFDPEPGDGSEHDSEARFAIDGKAGTTWSTERYNSARLGKLKPGVGLLLDMGGKVEVRAVKVTVPGRTGARLELRVGDDRSMSALRKVGPAQENTSGTVELKPAQPPASGRYVLVWFTELAKSSGQYRGQVGDVVVSGAK
jgi:hypothetical protein